MPHVCKSHLKNNLSNLSLLWPHAYLREWVGKGIIRLVLLPRRPRPGRAVTFPKAHMNGYSLHTTWSNLTVSFMTFFRESNDIMYMKLLSRFLYVLLHLFLSKDRSFWNLTYMFGYKKNNMSNVETWASTGQSSIQVPSWIGLFEWAPRSRSRLCNQRWK